jgi:hypothetical protein
MRCYICNIEKEIKVVIIGQQLCKECLFNATPDLQKVLTEAQIEYREKNRKKKPWWSPI